MAGRMAGQLAEVRAGDVMLTWEPLYHIGGSQVIVTCLQYGMPMALLERFSASAFWDEARRYRATQMHYLAMHADVEACAAIGVPSDVGDEDIKVFVKPLGGKRLDPLDLIRWCERHLAYFQIPRYVELVDEFPRTPTERIRKDPLSTSVTACWDLERSGYRTRRGTQT